MDPLVRALVALRTAGRRAHGLLAAGALGAYVAYGGARADVGPVPLALIVLWALLVAVRLRSKMRDAADAGVLLDVEIGALLAVGLLATLVRFDAGLSGSLAPSIYVLIAFIAAFSRPLAGIVVVFWVLGLWGALGFGPAGGTPTAPFAPPAGVVGAFVPLNFWRR